MSVRRLADEAVQPAGFAFNSENSVWAEKTIQKYPEGRQQSAVIPLLWRAQEVLATHLLLTAGEGGRSARQGTFEPPRLSHAEAQRQAEAAVDWLHRLHLRTLKALQDHRRCPVAVRHAGQVNVAHQQVDLAG